MLAAGWVLAIHWRFARWGLTTGFTYDDLMNLGRSIQVPVTTAAADILLVWRPSELLRPLPELIYRLTWEAFGANPQPFRLLFHALMLINAALAYWVLRAVAPRAVALTVALLAAHHPFFHWMYANTGFLFDLVCFFFYFAALGLYLRGERKSWYLIAFVLALNSKEIAVTLPAVLTVWELGRGGRWDWPRARPLLAGHLLAGAFVLGRVLAPGGIASATGYETNYSMTALVANGVTLLQQYFAARTAHGALFAIVIGILLAGAVWLREARAARLGLAIAIVGVLPLLALTGRSLPAAYIPAAGLTLALASVMYALLLAVARRPAIAGVALFLFASRWLWRESVRWEILNAEATAESRYVTGIVGQLRDLHLDLPEDARVLMLRDPFPQSRWMSTFALIILEGDGEILVDWPNEGDRHPPYAAVLTYEGGRMKRAE